MFVHPQISNTTCPNFTKFSLHVTRERGSVLLYWQCDSTVLPVFSMTSCLHIIEQMGQNERCFVQFARWRHQGQSLPSPTASCSGRFSFYHWFSSGTHGRRKPIGELDGPGSSLKQLEVVIVMLLTVDDRVIFVIWWTFGANNMPCSFNILFIRCLIWITKYSFVFGHCGISAVLLNGQFTCVSH